MAKKIALALAGLLVVALCFTVARHISDTLMAVIVGIVCGIGASIPMVLVVIWMMRQQEQADEEQERERVRLSRPAQLTVNIYGPVQMGPGRMANVLPPTSWSGPAGYLLPPGGDDSGQLPDHR